MEPPTRGLQSIFDKYPNDVEDTKFTFLHEDTLIGKTVLLPQSVTIQDLKDQVRKDNNYVSDTKCEEGRGLKLIYPKDGIEMAAASYIGSPDAGRKAFRSNKKKSHKNCVDLNDQSKWIAMKKHWDAGTAHRRDVSLVKYSNEVASIIGSGAPASVTLAAAKRLCCILGVPHNITSIKRLKRNYIIFQAVFDLIKYRDPHVSKITDNCEALSIACGCHLHWFLSQSSQAYRHQRTDGGHSDEEDDQDADNDDGVGVSPEYEKYVRLNNMGQSVKATIKQMLAEHLDPTVIGLCKPETEEEKQKKKEKIKKKTSFALGYGNGSDEEEVHISYDAPTTEALLEALRKVTGAIRYRQHKVLLSTQKLDTTTAVVDGVVGMKDNDILSSTDDQMKKKEDDKNDISEKIKEVSKNKVKNEGGGEKEGDEDDDDDEDGFSISQSEVNSVITGDNSITDQKEEKDGKEEENNNNDNEQEKGDNDVNKNYVNNNNNKNDDKKPKKTNDKTSYPWLEHIDEVMHSDWDLCSDECLDVTAYLCLGAIWCNLEKNEDAVWCHGEEVLSYALLLAIHGGVTDCENNINSFEEKIAKVNNKVQNGVSSSSSGSPSSPLRSLSNIDPKQVPLSNKTTTKTGFQNEDNYILKMQSVATHLACFLLTTEPGLKKFLAAQTSCPQAQPVIGSFTDLVSVIMQKPNENIINFSNNIQNIKLTLILPGLSELCLSNDSKIALCGVTMVSSIVATAEYRLLVSRVSAQLSLPAILTYALKVLYKRHAHRKNMHLKSLKKVNKYKLKHDKLKNDNKDDIKIKNNAQENWKSKLSSQKKKKKEKNDDDDDDSDIGNDSEVSSVGDRKDSEVSSIGDRKNDGEVDKEAEEKIKDEKESIEDGLAQLEVEGFNPEVLACLRGKNGNNAVSIFDHCMVAVWGLMHILCTRRANSGIEDHEVPKQSRKNRHHRHRHLQKQIKTSQKIGVNTSINAKMFEKFNSEVGTAGEAPKNMLLPKETALYEMASVPTLPVCHAAMSVTSSIIAPDSKLSKTSGSPIKARQSTMQMNKKMNSKNDMNLSNNALDIYVDGEDNVVPEGLISRVLELCSWNRPNALDEYIVPLPSDKKPDTAPIEALNKDDEEDDDDGGEEGKHQDEQSQHNSVNGTKDDGVNMETVTSDPDEDVDEDDTFDVNSCANPSGSVAQSVRTASSVNTNDTPIITPMSFVTHEKRPIGSGGSGYGPLSEVEIRCSLGCLSLIASVKCVETTALLGPEGLARVLFFAEMDPDMGASEEIQEVALSALAHLCSAADHKHLKNAPSPKRSFREGFGFGRSPKHRNGTFDVGVSRQVELHNENINKTLFKAWGALKILVNQHHGIERLAQLRQIVTAKARRAKGNKGGTISRPSSLDGKNFNDTFERERIKQRRWDMVKAVAVAIMHLSGLDQKRANDTGLNRSSSGLQTKHEMGLQEEDFNNINKEHDNPLSPTSPPPVSALATASASSPTTTLFGAVSNNDDGDEEHKELTTAEKSAAEKQAALEQRSNALATVMVAAQARSLFARRRLECVAQQLWGDNKTVVTEACASVWLLGRSLAVRAALSRLCVDGRDKETGKVTGRHFPMVSRLIDCVSGNGDDKLRGWALAAITTLCSDPNFQKHHALTVIPCLVNTLITYADEGDPKIKRKKEKKELLKKGRKEFIQQAKTKILPTTVNYIVGGASSTSAAEAQAVSLGAQRLAVLSMSALLLLAYFHPPSLEKLRTLQSVPDHRNNGFGGIEYSLYKMCQRKDMCRRVKSSAGHLLFLLCASDLDEVISRCPSSSTTVSNGGFTVSTAGVTGNGNNPDTSVHTKRSHLIPPQNAGPLWRLNASAHRQHASVDNIEEGTVLEELFLHMLYEEVCTEYDPYEPEILEDGEISASIGVGGTGQQTSGVEFAHSAQSGGRGGGLNYGLNSPSAASISFNNQTKQTQKDPSIPQAIEFGYLDGGDGDEFGQERDTLIRLCLHALTDLACRRDRAKILIINNGGANIASKLIREARTENRLKIQAMMMKENVNVDVNALEVDDGDEEEEEEEEEMVKGAGNTAKEEWKIIMPLHLILNCSTCEKTQPRLCTVALDDLIRATMTLSGTHSSAALEVQLAYASLANISRNAICRATIYKHSLAAGILPPGARDWTKGQQVRQQLHEKNLKKNNVSEKTNKDNKEEKEVNNEVPLNWEHAGRHPLYHVVQDHNTKNGIVVSAPKKDKSFQSCFGRSANNNMMQSTVMTSTMMSKKTSLMKTKSSVVDDEQPITARPSTAPMLSKSQRSMGQSLVIKDKLDSSNGNKMMTQSLEGSLLSHTANHPACAHDRCELVDQIHPSVGLYHLAKPPPSSTSTAPATSTNNNNQNPHISNVLKDGDLLSSLGFSTGHFGGLNHNLSTHATSGLVDVDEELSIAPYFSHIHDAANDDDDDDDDNNNKQQELANKDNKLGTHVAAVQSWMFNSTVSQPPNGAPKAQRIITNPPVILPDPSSEKALHVASNHPAAPLIAGTNSNKNKTESKDPKKPHHYWDNDVFNPPGACTTRGRTCENVSSKIPQNAAFPFGVDNWHPDIVDCHAERKEWLDTEGMLTKADNLAGGAVVSAFRTKVSKARRQHKQTLRKKSGSSFNFSPSFLSSDGKQNSEMSIGNSIDEDISETGGIASKMAKHKLRVLKKVIDSTNETNPNQITNKTMKSGSRVGDITLTINPPNCRGNHFKFPSDKERPAAPISPTKQENKTNTGGADGNNSIAQNSVSGLRSMNASPTSRKSIVSALRSDTSSQGGGGGASVRSPNPHSHHLESSSLSTNNMPLTRQKKHAVKSALAQDSKKKTFHNQHHHNDQFKNTNDNKQNGSRDVFYPELENVLNRGPMTASERRTMKLRAASAFASAGATRINKPRTDVSKVWMWEHVEGSQVSQEAGLIPYQLPVHNPLAKKNSDYGHLKNESSNVNGGDGSLGSFSSLMKAAILSKTGPKATNQDKFKNAMRIHSYSQKKNMPSGSRIITAPFFFHLKTNPAAPFPPPPLPPPPPPNLRCDVFQRYLPTVENGTSTDGASGGPEAQIIGEWAKLKPGPMKNLGVPPSMPGPYGSIPSLYDPDAQAGDFDVMSNPKSIDKGNLDNSASGVIEGNTNDVPTSSDLEKTPNVEDNGNAKGGGEVGDDINLDSDGNPIIPKQISSKSMSVKNMLQPSKSMKTIGDEGHSIIEDAHSASRIAWLHAPREFDPLVNVAVGDHFVCGGMPLKNISLLVRAPIIAIIAPPKPNVPPPPKIRGPPWDFSVSSIFEPRRTTTNARSMTDIPHRRSEKKPTQATLVLKEKDGKVTADDGLGNGGEVVATKPKTSKRNKPKRAGPFDHDWKKCLAKSDRFFNLIQKGITTPDHPEVLATQEALREHYDWLMYIFLIHAATDVTATDASSMGWMSYGLLMQASGIQDQSSQHCREADMDTIFKAANFEAKGSDPNDENPLDALTRQEWLEIIVRCAKAKYGWGEGKGKPISTLIPKLVEHMKATLTEAAEANEDEAAVVDLRHEWRLKYFYIEATDKVYREYEELLKQLYDSKIDYQDVGHHHYWSLSMWQNLMETAGFYLSVHFTREEGNLAFYYSKFTVYDYVKDGDLYMHMDWLSFLEAFGHVAALKELPSTSVLAANNFNNIMELMDKLELMNSNIDEFMEQHPTKTTQEDPFHLKLLQIFQLLFYVLDKKAAIRRAEVAAEKLEKAKAAAAAK